MAALFAEGRHPNADQITADLTRAQASQKDAVAATELGKPFPRPEDTPAFKVAVARRAAEVNVANGASRDTVLAAAERARIRTEVGREMFAEAYGRNPKDPRELSSFIARNSRSTLSAIAGFDLTFTPVKSVSALWAIAPRPVADADHRRAPRRRRRRPGLAGAGSQLHPRRKGRGAAAGHHRPARRGVRPPRLPRRRPGPAHPRRGLLQGSRPGRGRHPRPVAGLGRPGAVQGHRHRVRAVQHPHRGRAAPPARGDVPAPLRRRRGRRRRQTDHPRDRRCARGAVRDLVQAAGPDRRAPGRSGGRVPGRARPATNAGGGAQAGPAGHPGDPGRQARTPLRSPAAGHLAGRSRTPARLPRPRRHARPGRRPRRVNRPRCAGPPPPIDCCSGHRCHRRPGRRADHPGAGGGRGGPVDVAGVARPLRSRTAGASQRTRWCPRWERRRAGRPDRAPGAAPVPVHPADPTRPGAHGPRLTGPAAPPGRLQRVRRRRLPAVHLGHRPGRRGVPRRGRTPPRRTSGHRPRRRHGPAGVGRQRPQPQHRPGTPGPADGHLRRPRPAGHRPGRVRQDHRDVRADRRVDPQRWNRPGPGPLRRRR